MSECRKFQELMQRDIDGELSELEARMLQKHLSHCPSCAEDYAGFAELKRVFSGLELKEPPLDLKDLIMAEIMQSDEVQVRAKALTPKKRVSLLLIMAIINAGYFAYQLISYIQIDFNTQKWVIVYETALQTLTRFAIVGLHLINALQLTLKVLVTVIPWGLVDVYLLLIMVLILSTLTLMRKKGGNLT